VPLPLKEADTVELLECDRVLVPEGDRVPEPLELLLRVPAPEAELEALSVLLLLLHTVEEKEAVPEPDREPELLELLHTEAELEGVTEPLLQSVPLPVAV
jgi:hypothetical protein